MNPVGAPTTTFGNPAIGTASEAAGAGYKFGSTYALSQNGTAQSFSFYARGGGSVQRLTPVIYRVDANGLPSSLVAKGAEVTIAAFQSPGWVTSALPVTSLTAGTYLLGLMSGPISGEASNYYNPVQNGGFWNANAYPTAPATWGLVNRENSAYSFYVTYTPAVTGPPPANTAPPAVSGTTTVGSQLTASTGAWSGSPTAFAYQWRRCDSAGNACSNISGAGASTYTLAAADAGGTIRVAVTATNGAGSTLATSSATAVIAPAPPASTTAPVVSGTTMSGRTLSTTDGGWTGSPTSYAHQWRRCDSAGASCADIANATTRTYTLGASDIGKTIRSVVTASNAGGSGSASSAATAVVVPEPPANIGLPAISGTMINGRQLSTSTGEWSNSPTSYAYQWRRCDVGGGGCSAITNATQSTYTLAGADVGATIRVAVTARNAGGEATATSDATDVVAPAAPTNTVRPVIIGVTASGRTLTGDDGSWAGSPTTFDRQWQRCDVAGQNCSDLPAATSSTYALTDADIGSTLRIVVTAGNVTGSTVAMSDVTSQILPAPPANTALPAISGTAINGRELTVTDGIWTGDPSGFTHQWRRCDSAGGACSNIAGAGGRAYTLTSADVGRTLRVFVTATGAGGSASATSEPSPVVAEAPTPPSNTVAPTISGAAVAGQTLTATLGTWTGHPTPSLAAQWQSCQGGICGDISGAQGSTYVVGVGDVGKTLRVMVTATNANGTVTAPSAQTQPVTSVPVSVRKTFGIGEFPGALVDQPSDGYKFAGIYRLQDQAALVDFRFYARGGTRSQSFVPAIYSTTAGRPNTLITKGPAVTVAVSSPAAWRTAVLPAGVTLQPGDYALALLSGPTSPKGAFIYYEAVPGIASYWNKNGWPNPAATWGTVNNSPGTRWSFQVTYDTAGA